MTEERVRELFLAGIDCGQVVAGAFGGRVDLDEAALRRMAACFGGGMMCGETCGAVTAAVLLIGLKYGHAEENDAEQKDRMTQKLGEFKAAYLKRYPSSMCRDLLGRKIPEEMDKVIADGTMFTLCPKICCDVLEILEAIWQEEKADDVCFSD